MQVRAALRRWLAAGATGNQLGSAWNVQAVRRMFWVGFIVRLLVITLAHTYRMRPQEDHFQFGWEMGRIARALATGYGYADPFAGHTGPSAWTPPLYPLLIAGIFKVFGVYTTTSAWVLLACNSIFSAATAPALFELADSCYGSRPDGRNVAIWSGWLWALYPAAMQYAVKWPWDMAITAFCFTWALVFGLRLRLALADSQAGPWAGFALLWGAIALLNSTLLIFLPFQAAWILVPVWRRPRLWIHSAIYASALFLCCLAPWIWRNQRALHAFIPLRANFGAELYWSALPSHNGFTVGNDLMTSTLNPEWQQYARLGEIDYSRSQGQRGLDIIRNNPGCFFGQVLLRVQYFWVSVPHPYSHGAAQELSRELHYAFLSVSGLLGLVLSVQRRVPGARLFAAAFLILPITYYLITVQARFRHPLEPLITILAVYLFQNADTTRIWSFAREHEKSSCELELEGAS